MRLTYDQETRARAKDDGKTLGCIDCELGGTRSTFHGPTTEAQARFLIWCGVMAFRFPDDLPNMERMVKMRRRREDIGAEEQA